MHTLSIVIPCLNEERNVEALRAAIDALKLSVRLEYIFIDDGSMDATLSILRKMNAEDERVRYISFSRSFGKESGIYAGLQAASGDYTVTMDADLQHDPALLPEMLAALESGEYDCAAACRTTRTGEPRLRSWFARRYYALMSRYSEVALRDGSMDYRMMTRQVVEAVKSLGERGRFTKGIYQWVGFRTKWFEMKNVKRDRGLSKWSLESLFAYAINSIMAFSTAPLKLASVLGVLSCAFSFVYLGYVVVDYFAFDQPFGVWPLLLCFMMMMGGLQLFVIGILGLYISGIFREIKARPHYIVKESK